MYNFCLGQGKVSVQNHRVLKLELSRIDIPELFWHE